MADKSNIEWTDATWNPIVGCSIVSPGCTNCYAMKMASRIERMRPHERRGDVILPHHYTALTKPSKAGPVWTGRVNIAPEHILTQPLRWKRGRKIFVNSMGDLFHESIPDEWIDKVFAVMALCPQHTFQVLTKRAERMRAYMCHERSFSRICAAIAAIDAGFLTDVTFGFPFENVWLGVSTERQQEADERIPHLLATPAAVRFISAEPLLGPIDLEEAWHGENALQSECWGECGWCSKGHPPLHNCRAIYPAGGNACVKGELPSLYEGRDTSGLDWVIVGGESGSDARPMNPEWAKMLRDQCAQAGVPFFFKQWGAWQPNEVARDRMIVSYDGDVDIPDDRAADEDAGEVEMARAGKKAAGRLLDGKEHNAFPGEQC